MKFKVILYISLFTLSLQAKAQQDTMTLGLHEAIGIGLSNAVDAVVAKNEYISAYWSYRTYRTELLPEVVLKGTMPYYSKSYNMLQNDDGSYKYVSNDYNKIDGEISISQNIPWTGGKITMESSVERLRQNGDKSSTHYYSVPGAVTLEQPIFGFNRVGWLRKIEPVKYKEAKQKLISNQEDIAVTVVEHFFNLLLGQINMEIARQNHANAVKLYNIAEARYNIGQLSKVELLQMKNSLISAESSLTDMRSSLNARMFKLRSYLGLSEDISLKLMAPEALGLDKPLSYHQVLEMAHENNSFTQSIQRRMLEASRNVSQAKADRWNVKLFASFGLAAKESTFNRAFNNNNWKDNQMISVGVSVPILDWGKGKGKVRVAESNREVEVSRIEKEIMDFNQNIYLQVQNFNNQPLQLERAKEMDEIAQQRYEITVETFVQGKIDILNLNDSQTSKDTARRNYIEQLFLLWSYYYQIRGLTLYDFVFEKSLEVEYSIN